ncbi:MAG: PilZ domain-containing protein [Proteobacteria bacterium]|nr:PilZ domain-containing protein [Pseudomonadota bacterium]
MKGQAGSKRVPPEIPDPTPTYTRQHDRYLVKWGALIRRGFDVSPARVVDISAGGVRLQSALALQRMDQVVVVFEGCPGRPELNARVRHHELLRGELGLEFMGDAARSHAQALVRHAVAQGAVLRALDPEGPAERSANVTTP